MIDMTSILTIVQSNWTALFVILASIIAFTTVRTIIALTTDNPDLDLPDPNDPDDERNYEDCLDEETIAGRHARDAWEDEHGMDYDTGEEFDDD
jgi:hypothetical protein